MLGGVATAGSQGRWRLFALPEAGAPKHKRAVGYTVTEHIDFESSPDAYQVKLDAFEGPLDLLLHLIRKNELNIYDIPIAVITEQYLEYVELLQELDLDVAGEFVVMASTLIHIKSRMLLPRPDPLQEDTEPLEDPRDALVRRLPRLRPQAALKKRCRGSCAWRISACSAIQCHRPSPRRRRSLAVSRPLPRLRRRRFPI